MGSVVEIMRENLKPDLFAQTLLLGSPCTEPLHFTVPSVAACAVICSESVWKESQAPWL